MSGSSAASWAQLIELSITRREVHLEQLQLFVSGAIRHPALVNKDALLTHVARLRKDGVLIVESVVQWRKSLVESDREGMSLVAAAEGSTSSAAAAAFSPYLWRGQDYLSKMMHDLDFLAELSAAPRMLELPGEGLQYNPLFAPTTLSNALRMPPIPTVAAHLLDTVTGEEHTELLGRSLLPSLAQFAPPIESGGKEEGGATPGSRGGAKGGSRGGPRTAAAAIALAQRQVSSLPTTSLSSIVRAPAASSVHMGLVMSTKRVVGIEEWRGRGKGGKAPEDVGTDEILETDAAALLDHPHVRALLDRMRLVRSHSLLAEEALRKVRSAEATAIASAVKSSISEALARGRAGSGVGGGSSGGGGLSVTSGSRMGVDDGGFSVSIRESIDLGGPVESGQPPQQQQQGLGGVGMGGLATLAPSSSNFSERYAAILKGGMAGRDLTGSVRTGPSVSEMAAANVRAAFTSALANTVVGSSGLTSLSSSSSSTTTHPTLHTVDEESVGGDGGGGSGNANANAGLSMVTNPRTGSIFNPGQGGVASSTASSIHTANTALVASGLPPLSVGEGGTGYAERDLGAGVGAVFTSATPIPTPARSGPFAREIVFSANPESAAEAFLSRVSNMRSGMYGGLPVAPGGAGELDAAAAAAAVAAGAVPEGSFAVPPLTMAGVGGQSASASASGAQSRTHSSLGARQLSRGGVGLKSRGGALPMEDDAMDITAGIASLLGDSLPAYSMTPTGGGGGGLTPKHSIFLAQLMHGAGQASLPGGSMLAAAAAASTPSGSNSPIFPKGVVFPPPSSASGASRSAFNALAQSRAAAEQRAAIMSSAIASAEEAVFAQEQLAKEKAQEDATFAELQAAAAVARRKEESVKAGRGKLPMPAGLGGVGGGGVVPGKKKQRTLWGKTFDIGGVGGIGPGPGRGPPTSNIPMALGGNRNPLSSSKSKDSGVVATIKRAIALEAEVEAMGRRFLERESELAKLNALKSALGENAARRGMGYKTEDVLDSEQLGALKKLCKTKVGGGGGSPREGSGGGRGEGVAGKAPSPSKPPLRPINTPSSSSPTSAFNTHFPPPPTFNSSSSSNSYSPTSPFKGFQPFNVVSSTGEDEEEGVGAGVGASDVDKIIPPHMAARASLASRAASRAASRGASRGIFTRGGGGGNPAQTPPYLELQQGVQTARVPPISTWPWGAMPLHERVGHGGVLEGVVPQRR